MIHFTLRGIALGMGMFLVLHALGQTQTSGTFLNTQASFHGYTLLDPMGSTSTYLINNCGEVVNSWTSEYDSGGACYLLEDGSLARGCRMAGAFAGGGIGGRIERRAWTGELLWELDWANDETHHHHDFAWMPNGHVLVLAWEFKSASDAADAGRTSPQVMWPESIFEIEPTLPVGGNVVWEWHAWDHLVQEVDQALPNYGSPADYPNRLDVNYANVGGGGPGSASSGDWMHANAVNYNPTLDQIAISSRRFNEIWIVDHSTSTEEAAGPAGDLLYRYGNAEAYGRGGAEDRVLFGQHDVQWIPEGHPQAGQLMVYNNGNDRPGCQCSTIDVWSPPLMADGTYDIPTQEAMGPAGFGWTYPAVPSAEFYSPNISGVQPLPNGNHLICEGAYGHLFEVTLEGELVWAYVNPEGNAGVFPQGTAPLQNAVFRAYRYGPDYPGLEDKELVASAPLQGGGVAPCELYVEGDPTTAQEGTFRDRPHLAVFPNPANDLVHVNLNTPGQGALTLTDLGGREVLATTLTSTRTTLDLNALPAGTYVLQFQQGTTRYTRNLYVVR